MVFFYAAASLAGAFSGLLAYGIQKMDGVAQLAGWRCLRSILLMWCTTKIFILEGIFTVFLSYFVWKLLPDSLDTARFLSVDERELIILRLEQDTGSGRGRVTNSDKMTRHQLIAGLTDRKI